MDRPNRACKHIGRPHHRPGGPHLNILDRDGDGLIAFDFDNGQPDRNTLQSNRGLDRSLSKLLGPGKSDAKPLPLEGCSYSGDSGECWESAASARTIRSKDDGPRHSTAMSIVRHVSPTTSTGSAERSPARPGTRKTTDRVGVPARGSTQSARRTPGERRLILPG